MTAKISNELKKGYQPTSCFAVMMNTKKKKNNVFKVGKPFNSVKQEYNDYLISMKCVPGENEIRSVNGLSDKILICGNFQIPVKKNINVEPGKIVYIGRLEAVNVKRENDTEPRSGSIFPLIDQSACGFSNGTWHIKIYDNYDEDIANFTKEYPVLSKYDIEKALLE